MQHGERKARGEGARRLLVRNVGGYGKSAPLVFRDALRLDRAIPIQHGVMDGLVAALLTLFGNAYEVSANSGPEHRPHAFDVRGFNEAAYPDDRINDLAAYGQAVALHSFDAKNTVLPTPQ